MKLSAVRASIRAKTIGKWTFSRTPTFLSGVFGLTPAQADRITSRIEEICSLLPDSPSVYTEWRRLVVAHSVSGKKTHDARLVAVMKVYGIDSILTFNLDDFKRYPGIRAVLPGEVVQDPT